MFPLRHIATPARSQLLGERYEGKANGGGGRECQTLELLKEQSDSLRLGYCVQPHWPTEMDT